MFKVRFEVAVGADNLTDPLEAARQVRSAIADGTINSCLVAPMDAATGINVGEWVQQQLPEQRIIHAR